MKLLIADDSLLARNTLKRLLKAMGPEDLQLLEARNGEEAADICLSEKPDAMFLDLLMPILDGTQVLAQVRETDQNCFIAILSSNIQEPVKKRCSELGANIFIEKPITQEKISYFFIKWEKQQ